MEEVAPAYHMADTLQGVVDHDREVVARRGIFASDDDVAPARRVSLNRAGFTIGAGPGLVPIEFTAEMRQRGLHVEPPCKGLAVSHAPTALRHTAFAVERRRMRHTVGVARPGRAVLLGFGDEGACRGAAREGRVDDSPVDQRVERRTVVVKMVGLPANRLLPIESQPGEIVAYGTFELGLAARRINVLDAQQKAAACICRHVMVEHGGIGVAQMQRAVGAWGKAENGLCHETRTVWIVANMARLLLWLRGANKCGAARIALAERLRDSAYRYDG